jgi:glutathione S-transferase
MTELELIGAPQSNFVWTCRIALAEKGVPYRLDPAFPHSPEVDAIQPLGKIPAMRHGGLTLFESRAICMYVDRNFDGPALTPTDPIVAARTEQWVSFIITELRAVVGDYLRGYFFPNTPDGSPDRALIDATAPKMARPIEVLDGTVAKSRCLLDQQFTLADMYLLPLLYYLKDKPESRTLLDRGGHLLSYYERHAMRPTVESTLPPPMPRR